MVVQASRFARCIGCDLVLDLGSHPSKPLCDECKRKPIITGPRYVSWWISRLGYQAAIELSREIWPPAAG